MINYQVSIQLACVLLLWACPAFAQREFYEAWREVYQDSPNKDLFDLVRHSTIRNEIDLTEDDADTIKNNTDGALKAIHAVHDRNKGLPTPKDQLKQEIRSAIAPLYKSSYDLLRQNSDFDRLLGIYVQARNYRAALNDQVAQRIGLEGKQLDKFRKFRSESWRRIMEGTRKDIENELRNAPNGKIPRGAVGKAMEQAERKLESKLEEYLTLEQRAALQQLKGPPFDLPDLSDRGRSRGDRKDERSPESKSPGDKSPRDKSPRDKGPGGNRPGDNDPDDRDPLDKCIDPRSATKGSGQIVCL